MKEFLESEKDSLQVTRQHFMDSIKLPLLLVLLLVMVHVSQVIFEWDAGYWGVFPLKSFGVRGITTAPFIHGSWGHLISNSIPLFVLLSLIQFFYRRVALRALLLIYLLTGIMVWLFARQVSHIGASGVVFGLFGFMLFNGIFRRNPKSILLSLMVLVVYGGMFLGLSKYQEGVSYESHWAGFFAGLFASFWYKGELEADELAERKIEEATEEKNQYFLPRDIFEKTKAQRAFEEAEKRRLEQERLEQWRRQNLGGYWDSTIS